MFLTERYLMLAVLKNDGSSLCSAKTYWIKYPVGLGSTLVKPFGWRNMRG